MIRADIFLIDVLHAFDCNQHAMLFPKAYAHHLQIFASSSLCSKFALKSSSLL